MTCSRFEVPGGFIITCTRGPKPRCQFCDRPCVKLCDFELSGPKRGKTCSARLCATHARSHGPERDLCPPHDAYVAKLADPNRGEPLAWEAEHEADANERKRHAREWLAEMKCVDGFAETVADPLGAGTPERTARTPIAQAGRFESAVRHARDRDERAGRTPIAAKVEYVKSQGQTRPHHCHWPSCDRPVPPAMWGCREHWYKIPKPLRDRIWSAYRPGQEKTATPSREYVAVAREVQDWIERYERDAAIEKLFPDWRDVPVRDEPPPTAGEIG